MAVRKGSLLEENVESIFSSAGFNTETNTFLADYEIDVHAEIGDLEIIAECKQYEKSNLQVRNLIHEWTGKNKSIESDIVILVIYGQEISEEEKTLAKDENIIIWDEDEIKKLLSKNDEKVKDYLFNNLPLQDEELGESFQTRIRKLVWKPYLEGNRVDDDFAHEELLLMVKERIRRELFQKGTTENERKHYIQVFEEVTKDGLLRSNVRVKDSEERFNKIVEKIKNNETPLERTREAKYKEHLNSVKEKYEESKQYYLESQGKKQIKRLIEARLKYLKRHGGEVEFSPRKKNKPIKASRSNGKVSLDFEIKKAGDLETIRWIQMKEGEHRLEENDQTSSHRVSFSYEDIDDATNAVIRIMKEYYYFNLDKVRIVDKKKDQLSRDETLFTKLLR